MLKILFLLILPTLIFAQDISKIETIRNSINTTQTVSEKVQLYQELAWEYTITENDSALIYTEEALIFSKENSYPLGEAIALESKGLFEEIVNGDYNLASQYYFEGIRLCEKNNLDYATSIYHSLGVMFHTSDNYEKASEYYSIAYNRAKSEKNILIQKKCLVNLGSINSSLKKYEKAEKLLLESLTLNIRKDIDYSTYANLGNLYLRQKQYQKAIPYLEKATEQHPDNFDSEENLYFLINAKAALKDSVGMKSIINRAIKFTKASSMNRSNSLIEFSLSNYYRQFGDFEKALEHRDNYLKIYEEIKEKQRDQTVYELETKYSTEKIQGDLEKEKDAQKLLYIVLSAIGLVLILVSYFLIKDRKKNILLAKQKKLLETNIEEKNILLKETHHRVKNSFQIVSSLLYLQSENIENKEASLAIKDAQNRVKSMGIIHQKLYSKNQLTGINIKEYITELTNDIIENQAVAIKNLTTTIDVENYTLNVDTITPIGLIINELITNVIKHAFINSDKNPTLNIIFKKEKNYFILKVIDNGIGYENPINKSSFGLKLIDSLSKKLKASVVVENKNGTSVTIQINKFEEV